MSCAYSSSCFWINVEVAVELFDACEHGAEVDRFHDIENLLDARLEVAEQRFALPRGHCFLRFQDGQDSRARYVVELGEVEDEDFDGRVECLLELLQACCFLVSRNTFQSSRRS